MCPVRSQANEAILDFQLAYEFGKNSALSSWKILFQVNNLTDEPYRTYYESTNRRGIYDIFGRTFYLGFSYSN